ncbi:TolC family protein [uncultured Paludibaculum sp.]|uniref:TolC family protein n=1 Tax=uncultured Paludibaculum sp. TaxID=1765020 RepID=UPI002AAAC199|nr:TolC family protein [uncultured Paludibaculum sp.]
MSAVRISVLLGLAAISAAGQEKKSLPLSLAKAVEIATAPDGATRVRLAAEQIKAADARRARALNMLMPTVDGSYTFRSFTNNLSAMGISFGTIPGISIPMLVGPIETNDARLTATQSLFDLPSIRRYQAAKAQLSATRADNEAQVNQTKGSVAKAYLNALRADAAWNTAKANVALAERLVKQAQSQKAAGTGTGIDVTRTEVSLASERQRLIVAQEDRETARLNLLRAMGVDMDVEVELTDPMTYVPAEVPDAAKAVTAARELRPELKAQAERERSAKLSYAAAKYEQLPKVAAFGDYGVLGRTSASLLPTRSAGVSVKVPIFGANRKDPERAESASLLRQESIRTRDTAQQVELEIRVAVTALKSAESQVAVALEAQTQSEKELAQAERRYEAGVAIGVEVTDAQARVARARENNVAAVFKQKSARIDLGVAVGNIDLMLQ